MFLKTTVIAERITIFGFPLIEMKNVIKDPALTNYNGFESLSTRMMMFLQKRGFAKRSKNENKTRVRELPLYCWVA